MYRILCLIAAAFGLLAAVPVSAQAVPGGGLVFNQNLQTGFSGETEVNVPYQAPGIGAYGGDCPVRSISLPGVGYSDVADRRCSNAATARLQAQAGQAQLALLQAAGAPTDVAGRAVLAEQFRLNPELMNAYMDNGGNVTIQARGDRGVSPKPRTVSEVGRSTVAAKSLRAGPEEIVVTDRRVFKQTFGASALAHLCSVGEFYSGDMYLPGAGVCPAGDVTVATRTAPAVTLQKRPWTRPHGIVRLSGGVVCQWNQGTLTGVILGSMTNAQASRACAENARAS